MIFKHVGDGKTLQKASRQKAKSMCVCTFVLTDFLDPGERIHLHKCIWNTDHM